MKQYKDHLQNILDNGTIRDDRTNTGTISLFGTQTRYNLQEGFPAITTKKLAWRAVVSELLWFIEGSSDERRLAEILHGTRDLEKRTIWTDNAEADYWVPKAKFKGDLQHVYGFQWRKWPNYNKWIESVVLVKQNNFQGENKPFHLAFDLEEIDFTDADDFVGKIFDTNQSGRIKVLKKLPPRNNNSFYRVQFLDGINTVVEVSRSNIRSKTIKNPYAMSAANGAGCYGIIDKKQPYQTAAYNMWLNMMERCHGNDPIKTAYYKEKNIYVDSSWRCFANFFRDIHSLVGFDFWVKNHSKYHLDKDYYGCNFYGKKSTIFLPEWYNMFILPSQVGSSGILYTATNKQTGEIFSFTSPAFFNKHTGTNGLVDRAFLEQNGETKIWKFTKELPPDGYKWRQQFYVDQLVDLIEGIKKDPYGRRHILSAWNPAELDNMALPPCHVMSQFYVNDGKLSCQLYQRSQDAFLGGPFNLASYSLFTHMIAQVCDLDVGDFVYTVGDAHIYLNHVDAVKEQLARDPLPLPKLWLNPEIKEIDKFTMDDIKLIGYQSHSAIKAKMAV